MGVFFLFGFASSSSSRFYRQVDQGKVLIINTLKGEPHVTFTGAVVLPHHQPRRGDGHLAQDG